MKLTLGRTTEGSATLHINAAPDKTIAICGEDAAAVALQIAHAVNRDKHFEALVAALTPFRSNEMGGRLVDMIDIREDGGEEAQARLGRLVTMIDVILDAVEAAEQDETVDA